MVDRLAMVIHRLVSPNQTCFLVGRQIIDGVLIANEFINYIKNSGSKMLLFKVDFEKLLIVLMGTFFLILCFKWVSG